MPETRFAPLHDEPIRMRSARRTRRQDFIHGRRLAIGGEAFAGTSSFSSPDRGADGDAYSPAISTFQEPASQTETRGTLFFVVDLELG